MRALAALALSSSALALAAPPPALACGGLFCQAAGPTPPQPVDQNAERILFHVRPGGTITAHVSIQYAGSADGFAWVVPVPGIPEVEDSAVEVFDALDQATRMSVVLPPQEPCPAPSSDSDGCGCVAQETFATGGGGTLAADVVEDTGSSVTVFAHDFTGSYEYHVVGAEVTSELVTWLQENGYNVSDNMTPVMDVYNSPEMRFLAVKLQEGKDVQDIVPIAMTYQAVSPMIPLRLTAVAAQPHMGILVWILGPTVYRPQVPFAVVEPDTEEILVDAQARTSYFEWVARAADEADGRLFVRESSGTNPLDGEEVAGFVLDGTSLTRLYTRMSPEHMTEDPEFEVDPEGTTRTALLDLSGNETIFRCGQPIVERLPSPCGFNYCGRDAECTVSDGGSVGCRCPEGRVAIPVRGPDGLDRVTCVPAENAYAITSAAGGAGTEFDPCKSVDCGSGSCWLKGGFPTCDCDPGTVAGLTPQGFPTCVAAPSRGTTFGPGAGRESAPDRQSRAEPPAGLPERRLAIPAWVPLLAVWLVVVLARRRRRA